jgi:excisionase family DNA binding protein
MGNEFGKGNVGKGNDGSRLPRHAVENRLCITVPEAAAMLGVSRNFAYDLVKRGELPSLKFGKRIVIPKIALEKKLAEAK